MEISTIGLDWGPACYLAACRADLLVPFCRHVVDRQWHLQCYAQICKGMRARLLNAECGV